MTVTTHQLRRRRSEDAHPSGGGDPPLPYAVPAGEALRQLGSDGREGLSAAEAGRRLGLSGANRIAPRPAKPAWRVLLGQFDDFMVLVLLGAAAISAVLGEIPDAIAVLAIVVVNAVLGYMQEARAERSLEALRRLTAPAARALRGGRVTTVPSETLVPGDVLVLEAGDLVPADARLIEATALATEEAALTGESRPVPKDTAPLAAARVPSLQDRRNGVFHGSHVVRGHGRAVVVATGMDTEVGRIAGLLETGGEGQTPLQRRLDALGHWLVIGCLALSAVVVVAGVLQGEKPYEMFLTGVSLAVAAIPEGLPAIVTIALALGVQRMIARNAIVRRLPAVETLGCATVICSDKTGTLTQNQMAVRQTYLAGQRWAVGAHAAEGEPPADVWASFAETAILCNNAAPVGGDVASDPTEIALLDLARGGPAEVVAIREAYPRLVEIPFESERRRMTVVARHRGAAGVHMKGALEEVLGRCAWVRVPGGREALDARWVARIRREGEAMAAGALRVLALADRALPAQGVPPEAEALERELCFLGLVGMWDPPRAEVPAAIRRCHQAGVRAVMITGDHALTAVAVARQIGLVDAGAAVLRGEDLQNMGERELARAVETVSVFARVSPADKLRLVRALKARGHVVAMTGDGVNDAPAVQEADIGIAMGRSGTDVTREASALVLTDDHFASIVAAIEEGRAIYDNIRKFVRYLLACNTGEVLVMLGGALLGWPLPLLPLQLLLVNLVTDGLPALALGVDPPAADVMRRPPRAPRESIFAGGLGKRIASRGTLIGVVTLLSFWVTLRTTDSPEAARTAATCTLVASQLLHAFDARGERRAIWETPLRGNPALVVAVVSSIAILLLMLYMPGPAALFHFVPLPPATWSVVLATALGGAIAAGLIETARRAWVRRTTIVRLGPRRGDRRVPSA